MEKDSEKSTSAGGKVIEGRLFTHASKQLDGRDGLEFKSNKTDNGTLTREEITSLPKLNWDEQNGLLVLHGCNTGLIGGRSWAPAQEFAKSQKIKTEGQSGFSYFSQSDKQYIEIYQENIEVYLWAFKRGRNTSWLSGDGKRMDGITYQADMQEEDYTSLGADDPILLTNLKGLQRTMANIYNNLGKYLQTKASELGIDVGSAAAVLKVESGGAGFAESGKIIIRFENHVFYKYWGKSNPTEFAEHFHFNPDKKWDGHKFRKETTGDFINQHTKHKNQDTEWEVLEFARSLDDEAALKSISMGAAQLMGFNCDMLGYESAREMFDHMSSGLRPQLDGLFTFIKKKNQCYDGLKSRDNTKFAECFNGKGKAKEYGDLIDDATRAYTDVMKGRKHK